MIPAKFSSERSHMFALLCAAALAASAPRPAELYYEQSVSMSRDGAETSRASSRVYWAGRRMRLETGDAVVLLQLDTGRAYRLLAGEKLAVELDTTRLRARSQLDLATASDALDAGEDANVRTTRLAQTRTIAGHVCRGYRIRSGSAVLEVYLSPKLPVGMDAFGEFLEWSGASQSLPGLLGALRELPGFPLETRARVTSDGHVYDTVSTVTRLTVGPQPRALFELPAGYRVESEGGEEEEER
jgi:hypothetical protein